jgi:predicted kinase
MMHPVTGRADQGEGGNGRVSGPSGRVPGRLIHLNGPPGIGKSTLAKRYVAEHPGVLNCDVDVLRTLVGGWEDDFAEAGALIRGPALAMIETYLSQGRDVVLPQLLVDPEQVARFEASAVHVGAEFVERFLMDSLPGTLARHHRRGSSDRSDAWHGQVRDIVAANGGDSVVARYHTGLERLLADRPGAVAILSVDGAEEETYQSLVESLLAV